MSRSRCAVIPLRPRPRPRRGAQARVIPHELPIAADHFGELYGESAPMRELFTLLQRAARSDLTVLIEGETGTGKELAARALHRASPRRAGPYVVVDCASIAASLIESALFGHRRGAFSGAIEDRVGAFQRAHTGTILLDEIGELPLDLQSRLLRVLETGEVRRVGDDATKRVDVRVLAATHRELAAEVCRGTFRRDLLYRLDVIKVPIPPLRERLGDIPGLVALLAQGRLDPGDIRGPNLLRLSGHAWPGNVRELRNVLERAVALAPSSARFDELEIQLDPPAPADGPRAPAHPELSCPVLPYKEAKRRLLASFDRSYVGALLDEHGGNISAAAAAAGLSRKAVYDLIRRSS